MRVSRDIKFLDTGHVTCRVYDRNFYGEGVVDRWGGGGSSEGCLKWGRGGHQGISPKTSQNRVWGPGGHFTVKKTGGLAR